ncbi:ATP-binding cassette domain-containing protein [Crossiella sp. SN42]|uniref:ABC transporter ATP-binding protein n=1 Tax=Crossiella sp. SN42 TaxID=2944808 RepID=UPI00207C49FD|nr:ATP-binding cassette domain-containing protein [Crossiella sp. SN42]MCO1574541.1 ATP-binding cassette domain-containing protein [Crossiella sp. SN42]
MTTLRARDLVKDFTVRGGLRRSTLRAVDGVSFTLEPGRTVALVGESGSGKSTIARMIARLERPTAGEIVVTGPAGVPVRDRDYRHRVQMVFQDPFASLNPFHTVEHHLARPLRLHNRASGRAETAQRVEELLARVTLLPPRDFLQRRPHELSGGQRQRVAIARALAPGAEIVIADEPVSMLDVSIRLGVLKLLARLQREENLAVLYITHDLATARHFSDEILVLYRGRVVERGPADAVILDPRHPYTKLLAAASPDPEARGRTVEAGRDLVVAAGTGAAYDHHTGQWEGAA